MPALCLREGDDLVRDLFCTEARPEIRSFRELQDLLQAAARRWEARAAASGQTLITNGVRGLANVAVLGHSTALSGHLVSPINPRLIAVGDNTALAFQRGVQRIELISGERRDDDLNFYLLEFEQACSTDQRGCSPGDLYTPKVESEWTRVTLRDDEDLKNTALDCRQCHQRGTDRPKLLMRELLPPWTHFFFPLGSGAGVPDVSGSDLLQDYVDAKGDELYGGFAMQQISPASAFQLQATVDSDQPLFFDSQQIESERWPYTPERGYPPQALPSPTWESNFEAFKRGEQLALPYFEQRVSDIDKQRAVSEAYRRYRAGEIGADAVPDLAEIFPDDPIVRARIGLQTEPGASAEDALIQACTACHSDVLDQTISRARFSVSVSRLDRAGLDRAIQRISLPRAAPGVMPPPEARQLGDDVREKLITYLRGDPANLDSDGRLENAAQLGMTGGGLP
jgi:hypothetical protein